jgi:hypothetical protein
MESLSLEDQLLQFYYHQIVHQAEAFFLVFSLQYQFAITTFFSHLYLFKLSFLNSRD